MPPTRFKPARISLAEFLASPVKEPFAGADNQLRLAMHQSLKEGINRIQQLHITGSDHRVRGLITELTETLAMAQALQSHLNEMDAEHARDAFASGVFGRTIDVTPMR